MVDAKCAGDDPAKYELAPLTGGTKSGIAAQVRNRFAIARALCHGCPVIAECARDALENNLLGMVRGGVWVAAGPGEKRPTARSEFQLRLAAGSLLKEPR